MPPTANGEDHIGVVTTWTWPDAMDDVTVSNLLEVQRRVNEGQWRAAVQAGDKWVGMLIADVLNIDLEVDAKTRKARRSTINEILGKWIKSGALKKVERQDEHREPKTFIEVGEWAN